MTPVHPTTDAEYFGSKALRSSQLMLMRHSPAKFKMLRNKEAKDTDALVFGRMVHALVLEGEKAVADRFLLCGERIDPETGEVTIHGPVNNTKSGGGKMYGRGTKAFDEWIEANKGSKQPIDVTEFELARTIARRIRELPDNPLEGYGNIEYRAVRAIEGIECQCRPDFYIPGVVLVDLKTCPDIRWFRADSEKLAYPNKMAFYRDVLDDREAKVCLLAAEKNVPFAVKPFWLSPERLDACEAENRTLLRRIRDCEGAGYWPTDCEEGEIYE